MDVMSMTGFGRGECSLGAWKVIVEIGTVNRKQFDCNVSMPRELVSLDSKLQSLIHQRVIRGYVKGLVTITATGNDALTLNAPFLRAEIDALRKVASELGLSDDLSAASLLRIPEAVKPSLLPDDPVEVWPAIEQATIAALEKLTEMRRAEGHALVKDLRERFDGLRKLVAQIAERAPCVPKNYHLLLQRRIADLLGGTTPVEPDVLAKEVALFADRCDISEELTRLDSHFQQAEKTLREGGACGRTLDFLCQEMFREINTTGSKANDAEIAKCVIGFKAGLECIREQVQNIE